MVDVDVDVQIEVKPEIEMENQVEVQAVEAVAIKFTKDEFFALYASHQCLIAHVNTLEQRIEQLESKNQTSSEKREMTEDDARCVMIGAHRDTKHGKAAEALGLTYGQVYSARLGHTFKGVTKEMSDAGLKQIWSKK